MSKNTLTEEWESWIARHGLGWMPPLPEFPPLVSHDIVRQMMRDHALAAVKAYRASLKPVAYMTNPPHPTLWWNKKWSDMVPLYRLDGGNDDAA